MIGKEWATPSRVESLPIPLPLGWSRDDLPENFWWFVGRWVGDGWTDSAGRVTICCGLHERDLLGSELRGTGWLWRESGGDECACRWRYRNDKFCEWLRAYFGTSAHDKQLPAWLLGADEDVRAQFLAGYASADGYVGSHPSGRGKPYTSIHTVSRRLALGTRLLATTLDHAAVVYAGHASSQRETETYRVNWPEARPGEPYSQATADGDYLWGRIRSITAEDEVVPVYDLEVEDDHSFVAEGVVVHNCQDLGLDDSQQGTFSVEYTWGAEPPELGKQAAAQLAAELWKASPANQGECRLPGKVTRIVRQGVTTERIVPLAELLRSGATGLQLVDSFIALTNPQGAKRRSLVYSPDMQPKARQVGQDEYGS